LTGYGREEDIRLSRAAGFDEHLVKPANLDELRRMLGSRTVGQLS
jgi:CheY-like chemotaxis protein